MSRISLLTSTGEAAPLQTAGEKEPGKALLRDLQIDTVCMLLVPEAAPRQALLDALCAPTIPVEDIRFRVQVQMLFAAHPTLLDSLLVITRRLNQTKTAWDSDRSRLLAQRRTNPSDVQLQLSVSRDVMALTCMYLRSFLAQVREISQLLDSYPDSTTVLRVFREQCGRVWQGHTELMEFADRCHRMLHQATRYKVELFVEPILYTTGYILRDFAYLRPPTGGAGAKEKTGLLQLLTRKGKDVPEKKAPVFPTDMGKPLTTPVSVEQQMEIAGAGVAECDRYLTAMLRALVDRFSLLEEELCFYQGTLQYRQALADKGIQPFYPTITPSDTGTITMTGLYDLLLLSGTTKERVVPNDVVLSCEAHGKHRLPGMLIHGENNSGKTVFLRSVGTAILLAQCGLPIPATAGTISLRRRLYTQFATAEGKLISGSTAGRFEEEAAALAGMLDEMEPDSLFLLNETFQTTAYGEGAAGIAPILQYIGDCGGAFVFVTHLTALLSTMEEQVVIAKTSDRPETKYKVFHQKGNDDNGKI